MSRQCSGSVYDPMWHELKKGIEFLFDHTGPLLKHSSFEDLYTQVFRFCKGIVLSTRRGPHGNIQIVHSSVYRVPNNKLIRRDGGEELYERLHKYLNEYLKNLLKEGEKLKGKHKEVLQFYKKQWNRYRLGTENLSHVCLYLHNNYVKQEQKKGRTHIVEIQQLALVLWKEHFLVKFQYQVTKAVVALLFRESLGETIDRSLISDVITQLNWDEERNNSLPEALAQAHI